MNAELHRYELALRSPLATAHRIVGERRGALVSYERDGAQGWGDICPMPGWSQHELESLTDSFTTAVAAADTPAAAIDTLFFAGLEARAGLAGAVHDAECRRIGVSLAAHLAELREAEPLERVRVNATIGAAEVSTALTSVNLAIANGFDVLKLKVAHRRLDADLALVEATRRTVGDDVEIRLDANGGWHPEEAFAALERFAPYDIAFCEEPTGGIEAIGALGRASSVAVAVDESARSSTELDAAVGTDGVSVVVVKPQALGGPDLALRSIVAAQRAGVTPIVTSMIDSAVGVAHAAHVAAASGVTAAHGLATSALLASDVAAPLEVVDGHLVMPTGPGLGVRPSATGR